MKVYIKTNTDSNYKINNLILYQGYSLIKNINKLRRIYV